MFTGIIEETGRVLRIDGDGGRLKIAASLVIGDLHVGASVAVNGVCLTVTDCDEKGFTADVMPETFRRSSLGDLAVNSSVNLERAMAADGRFGGHIVSGHIDGVGVIGAIRTEKNSQIFTVHCPPRLIRYIAEKGSVALDGISLTVMAVAADSFEVSVIPHTRKVTSLVDRQPGDKVNIETDIIAKYLERLISGAAKQDDAVERKDPPLTEEFFHRHGF